MTPRSQAKSMSPDTGKRDLLLPAHIQRLGFWFSVLGSLIVIAYLAAFASGHVAASPNDLGLGSILLFLLASVLFFSIPWAGMGLRLKKFGPLEFERKLEGQSEERIKDVAALEDRIRKLELALGNAASPLPVAGLALDPEEVELQELVVKFLTEFGEWAFSPLRIENWGASQPGYSGLSGQSERLRSTLRRLVAEGVLETRISRKGNTLYRIRE